MPPGDLNAFVVSRLTQGMGGLFLVLVYCVLYFHRRRLYFLFWTLSCFSFNASLLLRAPLFMGDSPPGVFERAPVWLWLANLGGWEHGALLLLGLWALFRESPSLPAGVAAPRSTLPLSAVLLALAVAALAAAGLTVLPWPWQGAVLSGALAAVYAGGAVSLMVRRRKGRLGRPLLAGALALAAAAYVLLAGKFLDVARSGVFPAPPPVYVPFVGFLLETIVAVGMILVLQEEGEALLQDTLHRLAESEDRFRILFEHGGVGLALLSADGNIVQANPALEEMLDYGPGQLCGLRLSDLSHPQDRSDDTRRMRQQPADPGRDQYEREKRYLRHDGGVVWARVVRAVVRDPDGAVRYHASVLMDVTQRRRAEEALRQAEEGLRRERDFVSLMLQTADALVLVVDRAGRVVRFNNKCAAVSGYSEEEARGRVFWEFLLPERFVGPVREEFARTVGPESAPPGTAPVEVPWRTRDGGERRIAWRQSPVRDADDRVSYVISVGLDVTEQRRLEEQLRQTQKLETLATLVGGIAHDFNNQLTAVVGNLGLVLEDLRAAGEGGPAPDAQALASLVLWTTTAEDAAQRCAAMTARLLTFSRGRIGSRQALRLNQLLPEAVRMVRPELPPSVRVEVAAPDDTWPVNGDWAQLHQVVHALAVNAGDAMPAGGVLTLALANRVVGPEECAADLEARPGRFVELLVRDTGRGMTEEVRARLFEPFFTTKRTGEGAGLGLSEVYGVVKGHQGWIKVDTEPGRGSTFRLYLPAAAETAPVAPPAPAEARGGECVLVVDDEDMVRELARLVLERRGFRVLTAAGGEEALTQYGGHPGAIDLVLLDYSMPGLTGLQVFEALRKLDPGVCVVFSSGYALEGNAAPLLAAGARAFVAKPYRPDELVQAVRQALDENVDKQSVITPLHPPAS